MKKELDFINLIKCLNSTKMAAQIGVTRQAVSGWKQEPGMIKVKNFARLAEVMGLTPEEIGKAVIQIGREYDD